MLEELSLAKRGGLIENGIPSSLARRLDRVQLEDVLKAVWRGVVRRN